MPHLEEQFPPVNPLVLQRPDALDPPDRTEEDEETRPVGNPAEDEIPLPGSLADGIDRVTISANARVIAPVQPNGEAVPLPADLVPGEIEVNPAVPELLDIETQSRDIGAEVPATDEVLGASLQNFINVLETRRRVEASSTRTGLNPIEPRPAPTATPSTTPPPVPIAAPESPSVTEAELEQNETAAPINENRFAPVENAPVADTLGIRGTTPVPRTEGRVNILTPPNVGEEPPGINIQETRNLGQGRALSLDLATAGNDDTFIAIDTIDEALEEAGAIPTPDAPEPQAEILLPASALTGVNAAPVFAETTADSPDTTLSPTLPDPRNFNALRDPADIPGPQGRGVETSFLVDTRQVFEEGQEAQALQPPAFPEIDPDEPFAPLLQPEAREEDIPIVAQQPLNAPPPAIENGVPPVAPPVPGNVAALNENPQALRGDNLGTDPALRGNRELRNFLQDFNNRIEPQVEVTDDEGAPVAEVQNNAPPPPPVFENLEAESAELLDRVRERQATQGVTRPEEEHTAPPEPRTPETVLTERGQNIDRFI